ncbi:hypothetical protein VB10N_47120 [Vibrio sp. 10N]|nr:hypothetical protein VB10N_47120 [Vibrio sp. 10N]
MSEVIREEEESRVSEGYCGTCDEDVRLDATLYYDVVLDKDGDEERILVSEEETCAYCQCGIRRYFDKSGNITDSDGIHL